MKLIILASMVIGLRTFAGGFEEPLYCNLENLKALQVASETKKIDRLHAYRLGRVVVAGLAVGHSEAKDVKALAAQFSNVGSEQKFCTWYINDGNEEAEQSFNSQYVPRPQSSKHVKEYMEKLGAAFFLAPINFVKCAEEHGYIALGCNGMKHRGPTFFGMLLSFSGCSPESANHIVNTVWGLNGVDAKVRLNIIEEAYNLGLKSPDARAALQAQLSE